MSVIQIRDLHKTFADGAVEVRAVDGIDLDIDAGEFSAIVGPSGSGKTTLLNLIGGLDQPTSGSILIDQRDIATLKQSELFDFRLHHIGFVFQAYNLLPVLDARENVEFVLQLQGVAASDRKKKALAALEAVGLAERAGARPSQLSGGQQQRVAVARALVGEPAFILADEPTANLDSRSTETLLDLMAALNRDKGTTFLFSTHDQRVVSRARRVITVEDGRIVPTA
jgi:putative ABC transport system ATP-binding protein